MMKITITKMTKTSVSMRSRSPAVAAVGRFAVKNAGMAPRPTQVYPWPVGPHADRRRIVSSSSGPANREARPPASAGLPV